MRHLHVLNLGAGVQSTTLYLMIASGELPIPLDCAIFADTGEEPVAVQKHLAWLQSIGGPPILVRSVGSRLGDDLMVGRNGRFAQIPAFTRNPSAYQLGRQPRQCSREYKVEVIEKTIRRELLGLARGQRRPKNVEVHQYVGVSIDEAGRFQRMTARRTFGKMHAPLIERHMTRKSCMHWLEARGKVPHTVPRSACVFCPFHDDAEWQAVKNVPEDWQRAVEIDEALRIEGTIANRNMDAQMFVHRSCQPLVSIDFKPKAPDAQQEMHFYQDDAFSRDCLGVCGL